MPQQSNGNGGTLVLVGAQNGITLVPAQTPLTRLNYFDGKFLRAADLEAEQRYLRQLVAMSNQGGGPGVVHGLSTTLAANGALKLSAGLAIDPMGRVLLLPQEASLDIQALIEATAASTAVQGQTTGGSGAFQLCEAPQTTPSGGTTQAAPATALYLITICHAEALCGEEDVYGKLCEDSCVTTTSRPYRLEGLVVRALPLSLVTPYPTSSRLSLSQLHLRSRVASAYYSDERSAHPNQLSYSGLTGGAWCLGAGYEAGACDVPLAVVAREGNTTVFLDAWTARRERIEPPAKRHWAWKMRMRPWDVFLAQILQFQCQLAHLLTELPADGADPCQPSKDMLGETSQTLARLQEQLSKLDVTGLGPALSEISDLKSKIQFLLGTQTTNTPSTMQGGLLTQNGIVELPSAGYLPVANQTTASVNAQVRALLGEGVDLRFCVVRPDYVAHALEAAQHMERISLLEGLETQGKKPQVDVLVPDGNIIQGSVQSGSTLYETSLLAQDSPEARGVTRTEQLSTGGMAFYSADTWSTGATQLPSSVGKLIVTQGGQQTLQQREAATVSTQSRSAPLQLAAAVRKLNSMSRKVGKPVAKATTAPAATAAPAPAPGTSKKAARAAQAETLALATNYPAPPYYSDGDDHPDALWIAARWDRRFRTLKAQQGTPVSLRLMTARLAHDGLRGEETQISGTFTATQVQAGSTIVGTLDLFFSTLTTRPTEPTETGETYKMTLNVTLTFQGDDANGSMKAVLTVGGRGGALEAMVTRSSSPPRITFTVKGELSDDEPSSTEELIKATLDASTAVLTDTDPYHQKAVSALELIQSVPSTEATFRQVAQALLFPEPEADPSGLTVQAVHDWVLFHRRRTKQCAVVEETPQALPPLRYRVYSIHASTEAQANGYTEDLKSGVYSNIQRALTSAGSMFVEFEGGTAKPRFDATTTAESWKLLSPGSLIHLAAAGSKSDDSQAIQVSRIKKVEEAIQPHSKVDSSSQLLSLVPLPEVLKPTNADGLMIIITRTALTYLEVYAYDSVPTGTHMPYEQLMQALTTGSTAAANSILMSANYPYNPVGRVNFAQGTTTIPDGTGTQMVQNFTTAFANHMYKYVTKIEVWVRNDEANVAMRKSQGEALKTVLGSNFQGFEVVTTRTSSVPFPTSAPAIAFLRVSAANPVSARATRGR
ncbi:hypothetical protein [Hyalangium gracile]|uniref:hypothetical protein n=1 Tax=Hyalangium gracile TaxID=394092 RepID=UPI001CCCE5D1|nr:hypothetical protein [Hyalangium gracile]